PATKHPLYDILHRSPNNDMTSVAFWSLAVAMIDMKGNSVNVIERRSDKSVISLQPTDPDQCKIEYSKTGRRRKWIIGRHEVSDDDILHLRGFSMNSDWGSACIDIGRQILSAQVSANKSAMLAFKQGLKVGGFMVNESNRDWTTEELKASSDRIAHF